MTLTKQTIEERIGQIITHSWDCPVPRERCNFGRNKDVQDLFTEFLDIHMELLPEKRTKGEGQFEERYKSELLFINRGWNDCIDIMRAKARALRGK